MDEIQDIIEALTVIRSEAQYIYDEVMDNGDIDYRDLSRRTRIIRELIFKHEILQEYQGYVATLLDMCGFRRIGEIRAYSKAILKEVKSLLFHLKPRKPKPKRYVIQPPPKRYVI